MVKSQILITIIALAVVIGVVIWALRDPAPDALPQELEEQVTSIESEGSSGRVKEEQAADVRSIADAFTQLYIKAVKENNAEAATQAREYLTERGKTVVDTDGDAWAGLRRFALRLSAPDRIEVGEVTKKTETFAEVASTWHYPDTAETYYFYFMVENNKWRIDSIQSVQQ